MSVPKGNVDEVVRQTVCRRVPPQHPPAGVQLLHSPAGTEIDVAFLIGGDGENLITGEPVRGGVMHHARMHVREPVHASGPGARSRDPESLGAIDVQRANFPRGNSVVRREEAQLTVTVSCHPAVPETDPYASRTVFG